MAGYVGNAWQETAMISIAAQGGAEVAFEGLTDDIDFDGFEKDFELINLLNGGRLEKLKPEDAYTITLNAIALNAGTDTGSTGLGFFDLLHAADTSQPVDISSTRARSRYRICILWTDATTGNAAQQIVTPTNRCLRFVGADGFFTQVQPMFSDKFLKFKVKFKGAPFNSSGTKLYMWENVNGSTTATAAAIASYTSSVTGIV